VKGPKEGPIISNYVVGSDGRVLSDEAVKTLAVVRERDDPILHTRASVDKRWSGCFESLTTDETACLIVFARTK
jgi:hypothetical protein